MIPLDDLRLEVEAALEREDEYLPVSVTSVVDLVAVADREPELLGLVEKAVEALETATEALGAGEVLNRALLTARLMKETGELREEVSALLVVE